MSGKIRVGVVGLGKMGLSHFALVNAHPDTETVACDATGMLVDMLSRNIPNRLYRDYDSMLAAETLDAVVISTPSRLHNSMVRTALERGIHIFCEKPFCLDWSDSQALADLAESRGVVGQIGYHCRYVGAFREMKRIVDAGALGRITHVLAEAYGPVVLRAKRQTWRSQKSEGGGCLYDYAAHPLNLLNWLFGAPDRVSGSVLGHVFSDEIDDEVFATLSFPGGPTAQLSVNWSDESHRKMSTRIALIGTNGRINVDRQECQVYLRAPVASLPDYGKGWTVRYTTELTREPWFYLRGEEYSHQIDGFLRAVLDGNGQAEENDFRSAALTDRTIAMILADAIGETTTDAAPDPATGLARTSAAGSAPPARRLLGWFSRG
jgi:predicted dehydrogenase